MAVGDIFRLALKSKFGLGMDCVNVFHYKQLLDTGILRPPAEALALDWQASAQSEYLALMSTSMLFQTIEIRQVFGGLVAFDLSVNTGGTVAGEQLPPQDCPLISWRTGLIGRANRGRSYLPAPPETWQSAGNLEASVLPNYEAFRDAAITLQDSITGLVDEFQMVIFHTNATDSPEVTTGIVRVQIQSQRRRKLGVGS